VEVCNGIMWETVCIGSEEAVGRYEFVKTGCSWLRVDAGTGSGWRRV
jgi:hypothetical protein